MKNTIEKINLKALTKSAMKDFQSIGNLSFEEKIVLKEHLKKVEKELSTLSKLIDDSLVLDEFQFKELQARYGTAPYFMYSFEGEEPTLFYFTKDKEKNVIINKKELLANYKNFTPKKRELYFSIKLNEKIIKEESLNDIKLKEFVTSSEEEVVNSHKTTYHTATAKKLMKESE